MALIAVKVRMMWVVQVLKARKMSLIKVNHAGENDQVKRPDRVFSALLFICASIAAPESL